MELKMDCLISEILLKVCSYKCQFCTKVCTSARLVSQVNVLWLLGKINRKSTCCLRSQSKCWSNMQFQTEIYITLIFINQKSAKKLVKDVLNKLGIANTAILNIWNFSWRYNFRLRDFVSTGGYFYYWHWPVLPNVVQSKWGPRPLKNLYIILCLFLQNHHMNIFHIGSFNWGL